MIAPLYTVPVDEERFCTNCRAEIPRRENTCPSCGVFAGDVFDGRMPGRRSRWPMFAVLLLLAIAAAGAAVWLKEGGDVERFARPLLGRKAEPKPEPPPVRVVGDRPGGSRKERGAVVSEAEAIRLLRRELVARTGLKNECIALIGDSGRDSVYAFSVFDTCGRVRMGTWSVDPKNGEVKKGG